MGERRALVLASQCEAITSSRLDFLEDYANKLYKVLTEPGLGDCVSALDAESSESGLLINPPLGEMETAIQTALEKASQDEATLVLAFLGHAYSDGEDLYLLPYDGTCGESGPIKGYALSYQLRRLFGAYSQFDGMLVLLDACYAGLAVTGAPNRWPQRLAEAQNRLTILSAVIDRPAANGCFTRALTEILQAGLPRAGKHLTVDQLKPVISERCPQQQPPVLHTLDSSGRADPSLWLAHNKAVQPWQLLANTPDTSLAEELTRWLQPTQPLIDVVARSSLHRSVVVAGESGCGKSTLVATLADPQSAGVENIVPDRFVDGLVFTQLAPTPRAIAELLARQLRNTVGGFAEAVETYLRSLTAEEVAGQDAFTRLVIGPLKQLHAEQPRGPVIRIVLDGWYQLADEVRRALDPVLRILISPKLARVHLILTSRPGVPIPPFDYTVRIDPADEDDIENYLNKRLGRRASSPLVRLAQGNWLVARLLADLASRPAAPFPDDQPNGLADVYDVELARAIPLIGMDPLWAMLSVLAATKAGPVLPLRLFAYSCKQLNGPGTLAQLRDLLVPLGGLVVRADPGTEREQVGLFHDTLITHLLSTRLLKIDPNRGHRALVEAIDKLAPAPDRNVRHHRDDPLQLYARRYHAEHLWALGQFDDALTVVDSRLGDYPADNRDTWRRWWQRAQTERGPNDPVTLHARFRAAGWEGKAGDAPGALRLLEALLPDMQREFGREDPRTLRARRDYAKWKGVSGEVAEALRLLDELLDTMRRVLPADDDATLSTAHEFAHWTGESGRAAEARDRFQVLLPALQRSWGGKHRKSLETRQEHAHWTGESGKAAEALRLFQSLKPDVEAVFGPDHPETLFTRHNLAHWMGESGKAAGALRLFQELLPDRERVLGPSHPDTLATRHSIAYWTGETGQAAEALRLLEALLPDAQRVFAPDRRDMLGLRHSVAHWTGQAGDVLS